MPFSSSEPARLLITMGDPAGIGPELLLKSLAVIAKRSRFTVIGDLPFLRSLAGRLRLRLAWDRFRWINLSNVSSRIKPGRIQPSAGRAAWEYLQEAARVLAAGQADALVTGPVSKEAIARAGIPFTGHTEFLADQFDADCVMMFVVKNFRVSLVTTHVGIRELPTCLTREKIRRTIKMTREALVRDFGIRSPRIGVAALNPHGGEGGLFGKEEKKILLPAIRSRAVGPIPADSLMQRAAGGEFDAVVALYHDQALIPVKLIGWEQAVNVTLGLPFVRTSPVHGTAFDIAGRGEADCRSMRAAIHLASQLVLQRASHR